LFLGVSPGAGGMFQYASSLLEACANLPRDAYRVTVAYVDPVWPQYLAGYPFQTVAIRAGRVGLFQADAAMAARLPVSVCRMLSRFNPIFHALRRARCDLWLFPAQDAVSYQLPFPAVVSVHDLMHRYEPGFPEVSAAGRFAIREQRFGNIVRTAKAVLVDSDVGREQVIESYAAPPARIQVLPYIAPRYAREPTPDIDVASRYGLPARFFFYPAQFWEHKNHRRLLEALARVRSEYPDAHLVLCGGKKSGYEAVRQRVEALGLASAVTFTGYVPDAELPSFYRRARALIMPTFFGPTNIPPLEAFALGCPVAVSRIYGMPAQVGDAGLLFNPHSVSEIQECMSKLWRDDVLCATLRERGRARANVWELAAFTKAFQRILASL
jgi:glycosyltransferase involved in cell wall biosynthesis